MNTHSIRPVGLALLVATLATIVVASAAAGTIGGTAKNDTLRGTAKADKVYGRAGNDKLYGLGGNDYLNGGAGNDLLVGGPGADTLVCGAGADTVVADATDKLGADCEKVTGLPKPALSVEDASQPEGSGPASLTFTVTLEKATPLPVTVAYATADGTAAAGSDYTATTGQLSFARGETSKTIAVPIVGDTAVEADETFSLTLSSPVNATLGRAVATGTIANDDVPKAKAGHYHGGINNGGTVDFDITADSSSLTNLSFTFSANCQPPALLRDAPLSLTGSTGINPDLTFNVVASGSGITLTFNGRFSADGASASGTLQIHVALDHEGTHYECDTGNAGWSAAPQG